MSISPLCLVILPAPLNYGEIAFLFILKMAFSQQKVFSGFEFSQQKVFSVFEFAKTNAIFYKRNTVTGLTYFEMLQN